MGLGITDAIDLSGRVIEMIKTGATMELREKIMELREAVLNVKEELLTLREENAELKREAAQRGTLKFEDWVYWLHEDGTRDGPFCPKCQDDEKKLVRLQAGNQGYGYRWLCVVCRTTFGSTVVGDPYAGHRR